MAIFIPSAKIYEQNNNIVKDNNIKSIYVDCTDIENKNEYDTVVYSETVTEFSPTKFVANEGVINYIEDTSALLKYTNLAVIRTRLLVGFVNISITFPAVSNNSRILKVFDRLDKQDNPNINVTRYIEVATKSTSQDIVLKDNTLSDIKNAGPKDFFNYLETFGTLPAAIPTITNSTSFPDEYFSENSEGNPIIQVTKDVDFKYYGTTLSATAELDNRENITTAKCHYDKETDSYNINLTLISEMKIISNAWAYYDSGTSITPPTNTLRFSSYTEENYKAQSIDITFYGNTIGIDLKDKTITIPEKANGDDSYSFEGNELMQTTNYLLDAETNVKNLAIIKQFTDTLNNYKDGKETATLKLSIGEYYDNKDGTLRISTKKENLPMTFKIGDIVIPYIPSTTIGKDKPMSLYKDGSPKQFRVTRVKPYYSGASWQEIDIQEIAYEAREQ